MASLPSPNQIPWRRLRNLAERRRHWQLSCCKEAVVEVGVGVFYLQNSGLNTVLGRIGGGFRSSGGASGRGVPSEGVAIAAWKALSDKLRRLAAFQGVLLKF